MRRVLLSSVFIALNTLIVSMAALPAEPVQDPSEREALGLELSDAPAVAPLPPVTAPGGRRSGPVLLIPESIARTIGMYDPFDGAFIGNLISCFASFGTPINALVGPDGLIYVSDQTANAVFVFSPNGNYLYTYADVSDGLYNVRGIDFRDGHLFVTSGDDYVAEFDGPHSRLPDFINDGSDPFDILFLPDGRAVVSDIHGQDDNVRLYNEDGTLDREFFDVTFPEQLARDTEVPGLFLNAAYSGRVLSDFDLGGNVVQTTPLTASSRGVFRLWNGNLLVTDSYGVWEIDQETGDVIHQKRSGSFRFIELAFVEAPLSADVSALSASTGGVATFSLDANPGYAGRYYVLLGSIKGTSPGHRLPNGGMLPLTPDWFYKFVRTNLGAPWFVDFHGVLDVDGRATAEFDTCGPIPSFVPSGTTLHFAFTTAYPFDLQSNALAIEIVP